MDFQSSKRSPSSKFATTPLIIDFIKETHFYCELHVILLLHFASLFTICWFFTARCTIAQSAVLRSRRLSVRLSEPYLRIEITPSAIATSPAGVNFVVIGTTERNSVTYRSAVGSSSRAPWAESILVFKNANEVQSCQLLLSCCLLKYAFLKKYCCVSVTRTKNDTILLTDGTFCVYTLISARCS